MKTIFTILFLACFSAYSQADSVKVVQNDSTQVNNVIAIQNHAPVLLNKSPEILWFNNFRQTISYQFPAKGFYRDEENHEIAFRLLNKEYAGIRLTPEGLLTCQLSLAEYQKLPFMIDFEIFETNTPENLATKGQVLLKKANKDVPPNILIYPKTLKYNIEETDSVAIRVVVADLNEDLKEFEVYSSVQFGHFNPNEILQKIEKANEYWFRWKPNYDFVLVRNETDEKKRSFQLVFEAKDETDSTTQVAIDFEVHDKIDWTFEDKIRQQDYEKVVFSATESLLRLEDKFNSMKKEIGKMLRNRKLSNSLRGSINLLANNAFLRGKILGDSTKNSKEWAEAVKDVQTQSDGLKIDTQKEYPEEFMKIRRFEKIVDALRDIYVETEQFVGRYHQTVNRRNTVFLSEKEVLQKNISEILRDSSLELLPLSVSLSGVIVKKYFNGF